MFLYQFHELNHAVAAPLRMAARAAGSVFANPFIPAAYTGLGRTIAANAALLERVTRRYGKPRFGLGATLRDGHTVAVAEEVVFSRPFCDLLHFRRSASGQDDSGQDGSEQDGRAADPRLLVVAPLSGHHATLLRGTVEALLPDHDVYITDWRDAREVSILHGTYDLDDTIDDIIVMLRHLGPDTHVLAVCQPSVPVLAAVALMAAQDDPAQPASMILMGGPIDTRINPTQVNDLATTRPFAWFERNVIATVPMRYAGRGRRVYPGFLQLSGFMALNLDRHVDAHYQLWRNLVAGDGDQAAQHRDFYDEYLAVMDLPADYYLQTIRTVFQQHALPRGAMHHRGRKVTPWSIRRTALLTVEGEKDDITGLGQTRAAHDLCTSLPETMRRHHVQPKVGHYGLFNGRRWREEILPHVRDFVRTHDRRARTGGMVEKAAGRTEPGAMGSLVRRLRQMLSS
jgi:poly(3-hydroxybutyrate) depolymerase